MRVFLIPIGTGRYEPYCEVNDPPDAGDASEHRGVVRRYWGKFQEMLKAAERAQRERDMADGARSLGGRVTDRLLGWVAEKVAEQRLLWHLRRQDAAVLVHPSGLSAEQAHAVLRTQLRRDADRHWRWLFIDAVLTAVTGPVLFFVPGPNLVAYYFAFRTVGHYLSYRGARHGLDTVTWSDEESVPLADLGRVAGLDPPQRDERVREVARALHLAHLPHFFERMALPGA